MEIDEPARQGQACNVQRLGFVTRYSLLDTRYAALLLESVVKAYEVFSEDKTPIATAIVMGKWLTLSVSLSLSLLSRQRLTSEETLKVKVLID